MYLNSFFYFAKFERPWRPFLILPLKKRFFMRLTVVFDYESFIGTRCLFADQNLTKEDDFTTSKFFNPISKDKPGSKTAKTKSKPVLSKMKSPEAVLNIVVMRVDSPHPDTFRCKVSHEIEASCLLLKKLWCEAIVFFRGGKSGFGLKKKLHELIEEWAR